MPQSAMTYFWETERNMSVLYNWVKMVSVYCFYTADWHPFAQKLTDTKLHFYTSDYFNNQYFKWDF